MTTEKMNRFGKIQIELLILLNVQPSRVRSSALEQYGVSFRSSPLHFHRHKITNDGLLPINHKTKDTGLMEQLTVYFN